MIRINWTPDAPFKNGLTLSIFPKSDPGSSGFKLAWRTKRGGWVYYARYSKAAKQWFRGMHKVVAPTLGTDIEGAPAYVPPQARAQVPVDIDDDNFYYMK